MPKVQLHPTPWTHDLCVIRDANDFIVGTLQVPDSDTGDLIVKCVNDMAGFDSTMVRGLMIEMCSYGTIDPDEHVDSGVDEGRAEFAEELGCEARDCKRKEVTDDEQES